MSRAAAAVILALTGLLAPQPAGAQAAASRADTTLTYDVNGLRVIHHPRDSSSTVIGVQLYLLGGARQVTPSTAGVELFLLSASEYGTRAYPGDATRRALAETGSIIQLNATVDWTVFGFHGVKQEFDSTWAVFADRVMHPQLDSAGMRIVRARLLDAVARRTTSPQSQAWFVAESLAYRGHPYAVDPAGNAASLSALTADDLRAFAREHLVTSRMLLVVVGDVTPDAVKQAVSRTLGTLPRGSYAWTLPPAVSATKPELVVVERPTATNYIVGYINGPPRSSKDHPAFVRAMQVLSGWLFREVRGKSALSYAAYVSPLDRGAPGAMLFMSTTLPDSAVRLANRLLREYEREVTVPRWALHRSAQAFNSEYIYRTESASEHADMLARAQLYDGDHRAAARYGAVMQRLAFADLRKAVMEYAKNIQYGYVGDPSKVTPAEFRKR